MTIVVNYKTKQRTQRTLDAPSRYDSLMDDNFFCEDYESFCSLRAEMICYLRGRLGCLHERDIYEVWVAGGVQLY